MMHAMAPTTIEIITDDGTCPANVFQPEGKGPWPGVLFFMDGLGIRPALFEMAEKMASAGHYHDPAGAERHWQTLLGLFERTLLKK